MRSIQWPCPRDVIDNDWLTVANSPKELPLCKIHGVPRECRRQGPVFRFETDQGPHTGVLIESMADLRASENTDGDLTVWIDGRLLDQLVKTSVRDRVASLNVFRAWRADLQTMDRFPHLRSLNIEDATLFDGAWLARLPLLESVKFSCDIYMGGTALVRLSTLRGLEVNLGRWMERIQWPDATKLKRLSLRYLSGAEEFLAITRACPELESLEIDNFACFAEIQDIPGLPLLRSVRFRNVETCSIGPFLNGRHIESLALDAKQIVDAEVLWQHTSLRSLELATLEENRSPSWALPRLERLEMPSTTTQTDFERMVDACPNLRDLYMLCDAVVEYRRLSELRHLERLVLLRSRDKRSETAVCALQGLKSLAFSYLEGETDGEFLGELKSLEELTLHEPLADCRVLQPLENLLMLDMHVCCASLVGIERCQKLVGLTVAARNGELRSLDAVANLPCLVSFTCCDGLLPKLWDFARTPALQVLELEGVKIRELQLNTVEPLRLLHLKWCEVNRWNETESKSPRRASLEDNEGIADVSVLSDGNLEGLQVSETHLNGTNGEFADLWGGIKDLELSDAQIDLDRLFKSLHQVEWLHLVDITDSIDLRKLPNKSGLVGLLVVGCPELRGAAGVQHCTALRFLDVFNCELVKKEAVLPPPNVVRWRSAHTDRTVDLKSVPENNKIRELDLVHTSVRSMEALLNWPALRMVSSDTTKQSDQDVLEKLQERGVIWSDDMLRDYFD